MYVRLLPRCYVNYVFTSTEAKPGKRQGNDACVSDALYIERGRELELRRHEPRHSRPYDRNLRVGIRMCCRLYNISSPLQRPNLDHSHLVPI